MSKRKIAYIATVCIVGIIITLAVYRNIDDSLTSRQTLIDSQRIGQLPKKDASGIDTSHLADGLIAPTNKWFSGLALQADPKPAFPLPLSIAATNTSFSIGLPKVTTTEKTLFGGHVPTIDASVKDAGSYQVTRYDELSVDLTYRTKDNSALGTITTSSGSPFVFYAAQKRTELTLEAPNVKVSNDSAEFTTDTNVYHVVVSDGATLSVSEGRLKIATGDKGLVTFYVLPNGVSDTLNEYARNRVTSVGVSFDSNDDSATTKFTFKTANGKPTVYGFLPHQTHSQKTQSPSYDTLYGRIVTAVGNEFDFTTPVIAITDELDVTKLSDEEKALLVTTLRREINATKFTANDTYFSGKSMYRAAQLLKLAKQLNEPAIAATIQTKLSTELEKWLSSNGTDGEKTFYYDSGVEGIVGEKVSFGSQEFNDHHFHYGYFIYAASILAQYDASFLTNYQQMVDLLVADIANYNSDEKLPLRRVFDPYAGHSWASGSSPFTDGNNQESTSEATNAWIATQLWARQTANEELEKQSVWMLSNEMAATRTYWLEINQNEAPYNASYTKGIVALNWGAKRDYATFFSPDPAAALGIQLLPLNPSHAAFASGKQRIAQNISEALPDGGYNRQFADYILMYQSLLSDSGVLDTAKQLDEALIDGANSRSYMYAWIMTRK